MIRDIDLQLEKGILQILILVEAEEDIEGGNAVIAWSAKSEAGFEFKTLGKNRRMPVDLDGVQLVSFMPLPPEGAL